MEKGNTRRDFLQVVMAGSLISVPAGVLAAAQGNSPGSKGTYGQKEYLMNKTICSIYDERPKICRQFPTHAAEIKEFDKCTFFFEGKIRKGECCGCGQCCVSMPWPEPSLYAAIISKPIIYYKGGAVYRTGVIDSICRSLINGN